MARACCSSFGQYGQATSFCYEVTRTCATCWTALWHLDALCYEGCEGHGSTSDDAPSASFARRVSGFGFMIEQRPQALIRGCLLSRTRKTKHVSLSVYSAFCLFAFCLLPYSVVWGG